MDEISPSQPNPPMTETQENLTIASEPLAVRQVIDRVVMLLAQYGWEEHDSFAVHLAVEEAIVNAMKHGNQRDASKSIIVDYQIDREKFSITIEDEGPGFDPEAVPDPTDDENLDIPSGRGVMLIKLYMSGVEYNDRGNRVTMWRNRGDVIGLDDDEDDPSDEDGSGDEGGGED